MGDLVATEMKGAVDANAQYQANAVFADPRSVFAGQAICGDPETIHGIVLTGHAKADTKPVSMKSFHPKISGTACYAKAFEAALRRAVRTTSTQWGRTDVILSHRGFE
ncbi:hypothetical protein AB0E10_37970 [Streptomyces sp. NPDC048045]|uniref:hypothetical protein n=1 Tax=Streptomyces sp. NPDC048045 TaxID=3154710 RepID=UPI0034153ABC